MRHRGVDSFEEYATARSPALQRFAYLLCHDPHLAEDLVQEALARAAVRWDRIDSPEAYVKRAIVNQLVSWRRRRWFTREVPTATTPEVAVFDDERASTRDAMWTLLGTLPPRQRAVLVLRYYDDADDFAIAGILGCSPATVRVHASRALQRLRVDLTRPTSPTGGPRV